MKRLLCIMSGMNVGGAETFIMKIYRIIDKEKFQFDFCVNMPIEENYYSKEIQNYGGKIFPNHYLQVRVIFHNKETCQSHDKEYQKGIDNYLVWLCGSSKAKRDDRN